MNALLNTLAIVVGLALVAVVAIVGGVNAFNSLAFPPAASRFAPLV